MGQSDESRDKKGWGELGPKWIMAIAALITAIAGAVAGFGIGRSTAPGGQDPQANNAAPATVTVTKPATGGPSGDASRSAVPGSDSGAVRWSGDVSWDENKAGGYNFDLNPPRYTSTEYIGGGGSTLAPSEESEIALWTSESVPGKEECGKNVDEESTPYLDGLAETNRVCGRTKEGRVFRIDISSTGNTLRGTATVWEK